MVLGKEDTTKYILLHPAEVGGLFASDLHHYAEHPSLWLVTFQIKKQILLTISLVSDDRPEQIMLILRMLFVILVLRMNRTAHRFFQLRYITGIKTIN